MSKHREERIRNLVREAANRKVEVSDQEVARRAYALYERRGRQHGHDLDDWLQAETAVRRRRG